MKLKFSNQCLEVEELSEVLEMWWKLSERCLERVEFERSVVGPGKYVAQAGAEMELMAFEISNQWLKEAEKVTIFETFDR